MTKIKATKHNPKNSESKVVAKHSVAVKSSRSLGKRVLTWLGWGIVYVFVFYLGNVSGEYVAAHLPILPSLPRLSINTEKMKEFIPTVNLPKVSVAWKWPTFDKVTKTTTPESNTKLVIVRGNFINMPEQSASDDDRKAFVESINALAVDAKSVSVSDLCEINPPFVRVKQGEGLSVVGTNTKEHTLVFDQVSKVLASKQTVSMQLAQTQGAFAISCDGTIVGFYRVY